MFDQVRAFMTAKCVTTGSAEYMAAQDEFGRANKTQLREFFDSLEDNERKTALWVAFSCLSYEMAADVLKIAVVEPVRAEFDAYMAKEETESFERQSKQFDADRLALAADRAQLKADQDKFESYKIVGEPKATEKYSTEALRAMGYVGVYIKDEEA